MKLVEANIGMVKFYNQSKGYGFIEQNEYGLPDVFFHFTDITDNQYVPMKYDKVSYQIEETDRGLKAVDVEKVED